MECREACAACCIAPSISTPVPQRDGSPPRPKPAGVPCVQLDEHWRCRLFGRPERPAVCASLRPSEEMCGADREQALQGLAWLEAQTRADRDLVPAERALHGPGSARAVPARR